MLGRAKYRVLLGLPKQLLICTEPRRVCNLLRTLRHFYFSAIKKECGAWNPHGTSTNNSRNPRNLRLTCSFLLNGGKAGTCIQLRTLQSGDWKYRDLQHSDSLICCLFLFSFSRTICQPTHFSLGPTFIIQSRNPKESLHSRNKHLRVILTTSSYKQD